MKLPNVTVQFEVKPNEIIVKDTAKDMSLSCIFIYRLILRFKNMFRLH